MERPGPMELAELAGLLDMCMRREACNNFFILVITVIMICIYAFRT